MIQKEKIIALEINMKKLFCAFLFIILFGGCAVLDGFKTPEETPKLKAARTECKAKSQKAQSQTTHKGKLGSWETKNRAYMACMKSKGYSKTGRKLSN